MLTDTLITRRQLSAGLVLLLAGAAAANPSLTSTHTPTRAEWLRQSLLVAIYQASSVWRQRIGVQIAVLENEAQVVVVISTANGESAPTQNARANYIGDVRTVCLGVMSQYDWAKRLSLAVTMV